MLCEDLSLHNRSDARILVSKFGNVLRTLDLSPVNGRVGCENPESSSWRLLLIDCSHKWEELLKKSRLSAHRLRCITPDLLDFDERHI